MAETLARGPVTGTAVKTVKRKPFFIDLYSTAVGKKYVMALTGLIGVGFVVVHMIGNLKLYLGVVTEGDEMIYDADVYGEFLRELLVPILPRTVALWLLRLVLIAAVLLHIHAAYSLSRLNTKANKAYAGSRDYIAVNFASRTMRWTGPIILLYLFFHLADLTWGWFSDEWVRGDVYANVYNSMDAWPIALLYIAANVALATHIYHGAWSMFQTLGINNPRYNNARRRFAQGIAAVILLGNLSFPLAVQGGLVDLDGHTPGQYNLEYGE